MLAALSFLGSVVGSAFKCAIIRRGGGPLHHMMPWLKHSFEKWRCRIAPRRFACPVGCMKFGRPDAVAWIFVSGLDRGGGRKRSWSQWISNGIYITASASAMASNQARRFLHRFEPESLLTYRSVGCADPVKSIQRDGPWRDAIMQGNVMVVGWERLNPLAAGGSCVGRKTRDRPDALESIACLGDAHFSAEFLCRLHGAA